MYKIVYIQKTHPFDRMVEYETDSLVEAIKMKMDFEFREPAPGGFDYQIEYHYNGY